MRGGFGGKRFVRGGVCRGWGVSQKAPVALTPGAWHTPTTHGRAHHRGVRGTSGARLQGSPSTHPVHSCVRVQGRALFRLPRGRSSVPPRARALTSTTHGGTIEGATVYSFPALPAWLTITRGVCCSGALLQDCKVWRFPVRSLMHGRV